MALAPPAFAKTPGETHCYRNICHRVKTLAETRALVGQSTNINSSHYDTPENDRFNRGTHTSSGTRFDANDPTATASSNFPDGTELLVWNPSNGRAIHVRVTDFGPFLGDRKLDLTRAAAASLDFANQGIATLRVTVVAPPPDDEPPYVVNRRYRKVGGYLGVYRAEELTSLTSLLVFQAKRRRQRLIPPRIVSNDGRGARKLAVTRRLTMVRFQSRRANIIAMARHAPVAPHDPSRLISSRGHAPIENARYSGAPAKSATRYVTSGNSGTHPRANTDAQGTALRAEKTQDRNRPVDASVRTTTIAARAPAATPTEKTPAKTAPAPRLGLKKYPVDPDPVDTSQYAQAADNTAPFFMVLSQPTPPRASIQYPSQGMSFLIVALVLSSSAFFAAYYSVASGADVNGQFDPIPRRRSASRPSKFASVDIVIPEPGDGSEAPTIRDGNPAPGRENSPSQLTDMANATIIKRGSTLVGNLSTTGGVIVEGRIDGDCKCDTLAIMADGVVSGSVAAERAVIEGQVDGSVDVADLHAKANSRVKGKVRYCNLALESGAALEAECKRVPSL